MKMAKRQEWTFQYTAEELTTAATAKRDYHAGRVAHWIGEQESADADLRANGITIRDAVRVGALGASNTYRQEPLIDNQKMRRLEEAQAKVQEHQSKTEDYERWLRAFERAGGRTLELTVDDVDFFGL